MAKRDNNNNEFGALKKMEKTTLVPLITRALLQLCAFFRLLILTIYQIVK